MINTNTMRSYAKLVKHFRVWLLVGLFLAAFSFIPGRVSALTCPGGGAPVDGTTCPGGGKTTCVGGTVLVDGNCVPRSQTQGCNSKPTFFGLVPWYQYLTLTGDGQGGCKITNFDNQVLGKTSPILLIVLAILDDLLRVAGLVAVGFVIFGGFEYMTSQGSPDSTKKAQQTIINALIGLVIALIAVGLVSFLGHKLGS